MLQDQTWLWTESSDPPADLAQQQRQAINRAINTFFEAACKWDRGSILDQINQIAQARTELDERIDEAIETARRTG